MMSIGKSPWQLRNPKKARILQVIAVFLVVTLVPTTLISQHKSSAPSKPVPAVQHVESISPPPNNKVMLLSSPSYYGANLYCSLKYFIFVPTGVHCGIVVEPGTVRWLNSKLGVYGSESEDAVGLLAAGACAALGFAWWSVICGIVAKFYTKFVYTQVQIAAYENRCILFTFDENVLSLQAISLNGLSYTFSTAVYGVGGGYVYFDIQVGNTGQYVTTRQWLYTRDKCDYGSLQPGTV